MTSKARQKQPLVCGLTVVLVMLALNLDLAFALVLVEQQNQTSSPWGCRANSYYLREREPNLKGTLDQRKPKRVR